MNKIIKLSFALALVAASTSTYAAEGSGIFVRAEAGASRATLHVDNGGYDSDNDTSYSLRGGYYVTKHFAVEGFYSKYYDEATDGVSTDAKGFGVGLVGKTHLNESDTGFYLDGRLGLARTKLQGSVDDLGSAEQSNTRAYFGAGVGYDFTPNMGLSLNYLFHDSILIENSDIEAKFETLNVGFEYRF
jgi:OmpA-OmpF porin, OOP family